MTTTLATHDLEPDLLDELALIADPHTVTRKRFADAFRTACHIEAGTYSGGGEDHGPFGWVNPNLVRARVLDRADYNPRQYAALWSSAFLMKTDVPVQISGEGSRGNGNKSTFWRRWVG